MKRRSLSQLADQALIQFLVEALKRENEDSAVVLAALAEVDERKLYLPAGYPSMFKFCVHELHMSPDSALKRIRVARVARQFPVIFEELAEGRLNQTAVLLLKPQLTVDNAEGLLAAATHKTNVEIEVLLAERSPRPDVPTMVAAVDELAARPVNGGDPQLAVRPVAGSVELSAQGVGAADLELSVQTVGDELAVRPVGSPRARLAPLSPGRFVLQVTVDQPTYEQLRYAQSLLGHAVASSDVATVLKRALDALVRELEKKKFAKGVSTRPRRGSRNARHVPGEIRRTVWQRDGGQCTFVSASGKRCEAWADLEFDHIEPLARGGRTVTSNLRLRCRGHNQYEAERTFGSEFMRGRRDQARRRTEQAKASARAKAEARARADAAEAKARTDAAARSAAEAAAAQATEAAAAEVIPFLLHLGFNAKEARQGAAHAARIAGAPLEQRVRVALQNLAPPCRRVPAPGEGGASWGNAATT